MFKSNQTIAALEAALKAQSPGTPGYENILQRLNQEKAKQQFFADLLQGKK